MEIIANNRNCIAFKDLKKGDVFVLVTDGKWYIKNNDFYAVRLTDGESVEPNFDFAYSSNIYIYAEALEKQEKNDAEEEKRKLEEQRWDELVEQVEEIDERCEALRRGFMLDTNFNDSKKKQELVKFIVAQVAAGASNKKYRFEEVIEHNFEDDENIDSYINEHWNNDSGRMLMATAYASSQRIYGSFDFINVNYSDKTFSRKNNPELNKFYVLLCKLGYVMSDEEI